MTISQPSTHAFSAIQMPCPRLIAGKISSFSFGCSAVWLPTISTWDVEWYHGDPWCTAEMRRIWEDIHGHSQPYQPCIYIYPDYIQSETLDALWCRCRCQATPHAHHSAAEQVRTWSWRSGILWDPARLSSRDVTGKVFQAVPNHESHRGSRKQDPLEHIRTNHLSYTNPESLHVIAPRSLPWTPPRRSTRNQRFRTLNKDPAWPSTLAAAASYL